MPKDDLPFTEGKTSRGFKRTYWTVHDADAKKKDLRREASTMVSKKGKRYSRADQAKIVAERYQEIKERRCKPEEC